MELEDKICVITGGASGIGKALAGAFVAEKAATVVIADVDGGRAAHVASEIGAVAMPCDMTDPAQVAALVDRVEDDHGPIDLFCSNAGFSIDGGLEVEDDGWQMLWDLHVMAHVYAARAVVPSMEARGGGYLLQTVSAAGMLASLSSMAYTATKHASLSVAEWLAITLLDKGIRVSALCPLVVDTPLSARFARDAFSGRTASPSEVASAAVDGIREETFLILPHDEVAEYERRRATDRDRWLAGMARAWQRAGS